MKVKKLKINIFMINLLLLCSCRKSHVFKTKLIPFYIIQLIFFSLSFFLSSLVLTSVYMLTVGVQAIVALDHSQ